MSQSRSAHNMSLRIVTVIGLGLFLYSIRVLLLTTWDDTRGWLPLIPFALAFAYYNKVRFPGTRADISVSDTLVCVAMMLFGPYPAIAISGLNSALRTYRSKKSFDITLFNFGASVISVFLATMMVSRLFPNSLGRGLMNSPGLSMAGPSVLLVGSYYCLLVLFSPAVERNRSALRGIWREKARWVGGNSLAGSFVAIVVCLVIKFIGFYILVIVAPSLLIIYFTYKFYLDKVENSNKHLSELSSLYHQVSQSKAEWESTFNAMSDAILLFDREARLTRINEAGLSLEKTASPDGLLERTCCELGITCEPTICRVKEVLKIGSRYIAEIDRYEGSFLITGDPLVDGEGRLQGVVFILKNVTEQKRLREQLVQSEKMSAVGQLVSGVAHELNNPLTSVIGYSEMAQHDPEVNDESRRHLGIIVQESMRARRIVKNLLTFARQHKPEKNLNQINSVLERVIELRAYEMKVHSINVELDLGDLPMTMCDGPQLQQVFLNIIINAEQAMLEAQGPGQLTVKSQQVDDLIRITVKDDGPGIAPENLNKVFDPFFTTKQVGKGTGLGLSICYGIVEEHGGKLYARSSAERGTTFFIDLPINSVAPEQVEAPIEVIAETRQVTPKQILVVDDEDFIADIVRGILEKEGHAVSTTNSGRSALELIGTQRFDLIVSDIKMPELTGDVLYEKIRERDAELASRMIFMTGDIVNDETQRFLKRTGNNYIPKPFAIDELLKSIQTTVLGEAA